MDNEDQIKQVEREVMNLLLKGEHPIPRMLRQQWQSCTDRKIELTGVGFFIRYSLLPDAPILEEEPSFEVSGVHAELTGLNHGAGFVLFVRKGRISTLEGYTYDQPWPDIVEGLELSYTDGKAPDWDNIENS